MQILKLHIWTIFIVIVLGTNLVYCVDKLARARAVLVFDLILPHTDILYWFNLVNLGLSWMIIQLINYNVVRLYKFFSELDLILLHPQQSLILYLVYSVGSINLINISGVNKKVSGNFYIPIAYRTFLYLQKRNNNPVLMIRPKIPRKAR